MAILLFIGVLQCLAEMSIGLHPDYAEFF